MHNSVVNGNNLVKEGLSNPYGALWLAIVKVLDSERYSKYVEEAAQPVKKHGGTLLARSNHTYSLEGEVIKEVRRVVTIAFPSEEDAKNCFYSTEYQSARKYRVGAAQTELFLLSLEGGKKFYLETPAD